MWSSVPHFKHIFQAGGCIAILTLWAASLLGTPGWAQSTKLDEQIKFSAEYQLERDSRRGVILVTVQMPKGNHIYALSQKGNPPPSRIRVGESSELEVAKSFLPDRKPTVVEKDPTFGRRVEKHRSKVIFWAPFKRLADAPPFELSFDLRFSGTVCQKDGACFPILNRPIPVRFGGYYLPPTDKKPLGSMSTSSIPQRDIHARKR